MIITYVQAVILGLFQGITELFPISSLGHSVILPSLLGWSIDQQNNYFIVFLVATHLATSLVLLGFFFKDWILIVKGVFRSLKNRKINHRDTYEKLGWLIIIGTIPAGILGLLLQKKLGVLFASPLAAAAFLFLNGLLLLGAEFLKNKKSGTGSAEQQRTAISENSSTENDRTISKLSWLQSFKIGCAQALALIPGFSRTGSALSGGLAVGLNHEDAARFSFLLATPIIFSAAILKLPDLIHTSKEGVGAIIAGALTAAIAAYVSVKFLTNYFKTKTLTPFAVYCMAAGALAFAILVIR